MKSPKPYLLIALSLFFFGCATVSNQDQPDNRATLKVQSSFQKHYTNNLLIKVSTIDGAKAKRMDNLRKTHRLTPGKRTVVVTGDFERFLTSVSFTFVAKPKETYSVTGRFDLLRSGRFKHYYVLQNGRGTVLQRKSATTD